MSDIFPLIDANIWAARYNLKFSNKPCIKCGEIQETSIPWASKNWRGLMSPSHGCGDEYRLITAIMRDDLKLKSWKKFYAAIISGEA